MTLTASHASFLKKLREDTGVEDLSVNPAATLAAMDARYITSSTRAVLTMLRKVYPDNKKFEQEMKDRYKTYKKIDTTQQPTAKQEENFVSWDNIIAFRDQYYDEMSPTQRLLMALYTRIPPVRIDYTPMKIIPRKLAKYEDGMNYLVMTKKPYFIFHSYKTHGTYGDLTTVIPKDLQKEIAAYRALFPNQTYLFETGGKPWKESKLGVEVRKIFKQFHGLNTGVNLLRHAYDTKFYEGHKSLAEITKLSTAMMHSPMLGQAYRFLSLE